MFRYLETKTMNGNRVTFKLDAIKEFMEIKASLPTRPQEGTCINEKHVVAMPYDAVKRVVSGNDRVAIDYENWPPVLLWLTRDSVADFIQDLGVNGAFSFICDMVNHCETEHDCLELWKEYSGRAAQGRSMDEVEVETP